MVQLLINGIAQGAVYGLVALGFVLIFNSVRMINFAQGEFLMAGAFFSVIVAGQVGLPLWATLPAVIVFGAILGWLFQLITYYPLRNKPLLTGIVATIAMGIILQNVALVIVGPGPYGLESILSTRPTRYAGLIILPHQVLIVVVTGLALLALHIFLNRTRHGVMLRATAQDQEAARIIGIRVKHTIAIAFMLSASLAALAGFLITPLFFATPGMGLPVFLKAFAAAVIGGFGSLHGAVVGGLLIGVSEIFVAGYLTSSYRDAVAFAMLMTFLYARPEGIFGEPARERV